MSPRPTSASVYSFRALAVDDVVHQRLGHRRVVALVVPAPAVADQVDDDVLLERLAVVDRQPGHPDDGLGVVAVHVEDRRVDHPGHVGRVEARPGSRRARGEADLVVDDHVHGAAGAVAAQLGQVQRLGDHALSGERGVAVQQDGHDGEAVLALVDHVLLGPHDALEDGVDRLQVARVAGQRDGDLGVLAERVGERPAGPQVVLHVAGTLDRAGVDVALELPEDLGVALAEHVGEHVEATAVGHADRDLVEAVVGAGDQDLVQQRDDGLAALETEALLADVLGLQEGLERLRGVEPAQHVLLLLTVGLIVLDLDPLLEPVALLGVGDVHVLDADRAAVGVAQHAEDVPQRHQPLAGESADRELPVEIPERQLVLEDVQVGVGADPVLERVGVGHEVAVASVGLDHLDDPGFLVDLPLARDPHVRHPAHRRVRDPQRPEDLVVEVVVAQQQAVQAPQEVTGLGALDDAVVVRRGQGDDLRDGHLGQRVGVHPLELGRVLHRADADDRALTCRQPRHRVVGADRARVGQADRRPREVRDGELVGPRAPDDVLVGPPELREVHLLGALDRCHDQ
jgi:hypothetical protein